MDPIQVFLFQWASAKSTTPSSAIVATVAIEEPNSGTPVTHVGKLSGSVLLGAEQPEGVAVSITVQLSDRPVVLHPFVQVTVSTRLAVSPAFAGAVTLKDFSVGVAEPSVVTDILGNVPGFQDQPAGGRLVVTASVQGFDTLQPSPVIIPVQPTK